MSNLVCIEYSDNMIDMKDIHLNMEDIFAIDHPRMFQHCIFLVLLEGKVDLEDRVDLVGKVDLGDMVLVVYLEVEVFYTWNTVLNTNNILFYTDKYQTSIKNEVSYSTYHRNCY